MTANTGFNVVRPTGDSLTGTLGTVNFNAINGVQIEDGIPAGYGTPTDKPGIRIELVTQSDHGNNILLQNITSLSHTITNSRNEHWSRGGLALPIADDPVPYSLVADTTYSDGRHFYAPDSPAMALQPFTPSQETNDYAKTGNISTSFSDYLMFMPTRDPSGNSISDAVYVPLGNLTWSWSGQMSGGSVDAQGNYNVTSGPPWGTNSVGSYSVSSTFPVWGADASQLRWSKQ